MNKIISIVTKFLNSSYLPDDSEDEKLKKSTLLLMSFPFAIAGLVWGLLYFYNGLYLSGSIPFVYGILSLLSIFLFIITKKFRLFRFSQIFLILILPTSLQISLGGFIPSSAVIIWAILSPLGALVYYDVRQSLSWFVAYLVVVIIAYTANDWAQKNFDWNISENFINNFFAMNIIAVSMLIYAIQYYFVGKQSDLKKIISIRNEEITNSINYARRIQQAMLPKKEEIYLALPNCFILFKPKDIVSGDFYFFHKNEHSIFIASADCTGHGVPGALLSMIGSEKLKDAISQSTDTSEIIQLLNQGIKTSLKQSDSNESTRDGMDIALCSIDINRTVKYAGANRPLWIIRNGQTFVEEIKATKKAIGGFTGDSQHFDSHEIQLQQGDTFYIFSDGYADTFNGKDGKKLMTKRFKEILLGIQDKSMQEQEFHLDNFIENWKAGTEQIDDILVIGVRL
jgi:serine phosphatase RsbU (regulator of sigma subunit)